MDEQLLKKAAEAVLLKPSGVVILESVWKDIVSKEMKCPVTGKKLKGEEEHLSGQCMQCN